MTDDWQIYLLLGLAVVYSPFVLAYGAFRKVRGGGVWKFLSFCFCTLALLSAFGISPWLGILLWLVAWVFAGVARSTANRDAGRHATLRAIREQNDLLRKQQELLTQQQGLPATPPETLPRNRGSPSQA
jgi:hypothetical protein